jgi:hypothetical protein
VATSKKDRVQETVDATKKFQNASEAFYDEQISNLLNPYYRSENVYNKGTGDFVAARRDMKEKAAAAKRQGRERDFANLMRRLTPSGGSNTVTGRVNRKKGGVIKSSASRRADGIAQRGKTKGRFV